MAFSLLSRTVANSAARLTTAHHHRRFLQDRLNGIRKSHIDGQQRDLIDKKKMIAESEKFLVEHRYHRMLDEHENLNTKFINIDVKLTQAVDDLNFTMKDIKNFKLKAISDDITLYFASSCLIFVGTLVNVATMVDVNKKS